MSLSTPSPDQWSSTGDAALLRRTAATGGLAAVEDLITAAHETSAPPDEVWIAAWELIAPTLADPDALIECLSAFVERNPSASLTLRGLLLQAELELTQRRFVVASQTLRTLRSFDIKPPLDQRRAALFAWASVGQGDLSHLEPLELLMAQGTEEATRRIAAEALAFAYAPRGALGDLERVMMVLDDTKASGVRLYRAFLSLHGGDREATLAQFEVVFHDDPIPARRLDAALALVSLHPEPAPYLEGAESIAQAHGAPQMRFRVMEAQAQQAFLHGDHTQARRIATLFTGDDDAPASAGITSILAATGPREIAFAAAMKLLEASLAEQLPSQLATAHRVLAGVVDDPVERAVHIREARTIYAELRDLQGLASALIEQAKLLLDLRDLGPARDVIAELAIIARDTGQAELADTVAALTERCNRLGS